MSWISGPQSDPEPNLGSEHWTPQVSSRVLSLSLSPYSPEQSGNYNPYEQQDLPMRSLTPFVFLKTAQK